MFGGFGTSQSISLPNSLPNVSIGVNSRDVNGPDRFRCMIRQHKKLKYTA